MKPTYQIQVGRRGVIRLPIELRDQRGISDGDILNLIDNSKNVMALSRRRSPIDKIADRLAKEKRDAGESLASMQATLREVWTEYEEEHP